MGGVVQRLPAVLVAVGIMAATFGISIWSSRRAERKATPDVDPMAGWELPDLGSPRSDQTYDRPNIVLIIGCSLRRDVFAAYGGGGVAPHLDERSTQGVVFEDPIASATWTRASVASMLTGGFASATGVVEPSDGASRRGLERGRLLSQRMRDQGYRTFGATSSSHLNVQFGADRGFDVYVDGPPISKSKKRKRRKFYGDVLLEQALPKLATFADEGEGPAFVQVFVNDAHAPARLSARAVEPFQRDGENQVQANYRAMVHRFDRTVQLFEQGLRHLGFNTGNTVFVVVGDHGEGLGLVAGHGRHHGTSTQSSIAEVPMQIWGRHVHGAHRVGGLFSLRELPDLVEGVSRADSRFSAMLDGRSDDTETTRAWVDNWYRMHREVAFYEKDRTCRVDYKLPSPEVFCVDRDGQTVLAEPGDKEVIDAFRQAREDELQ